MFGSGLLALLFAVGIPFCLGYFSRRHWLIAALTYAGSFAISAAAFTLVFYGWTTAAWQKLPMVFCVIFLLFMVASVPSIVGAGLGALCRWCELEMQRSQGHKEAEPSDAIRVGVRVDPVRIEQTSHSSTSVYRRSRF